MRSSEMAINNEPSVGHHNHHHYIPGAKKLGQKRLSKSLHEEFLSKDKERECIDTLLECSPQDEDFDDVVHCLNWEEVSVGWRTTVPNVTYISRTTESNSKKDTETGKERGSTKNKNSQRLISFEKDQAWKQCVEPGTYRYIHRSAHVAIPKKKAFNKGPVKRPMDPQLQEHIRKVREHLEKVLVQQASTTVQQKPARPVHNHGDYVVSLIRDANPNRPQPQIETLFSPGLNGPVDENAQIQTKVPDVGVTYTVKRRSPVQKSSPLPAHPPSHRENKSPNDLVAALGSKLNELIQKDNLNSTVKTTKQSRKRIDEKLRSSYEKFTVPAKVDSPPLKPLVKVTPGQRKIHDDNEVIGAVAQMNKQVAFQFDDSYSSRRTSPSPSKENQTLHQRKVKTKREDVQTLSYNHLDPANKDFFTSGISGKAMSPSDIEVQVQRFTGVSGILNITKHPVEVKKRGTLHPQKQVLNPMSGRGDHGFSISSRLGDPLHRGVVDRGVAGAIASELLPGVNGHKIRVPLHIHQAYRIV